MGYTSQSSYLWCDSKWSFLFYFHAQYYLYHFALHLTMHLFQATSVLFLKVFWTKKASLAMSFSAIQIPPRLYKNDMENAAFACDMDQPIKRWYLSTTRYIHKYWYKPGKNSAKHFEAWSLIVSFCWSVYCGLDSSDSCPLGQTVSCKVCT